MNYLPLAAQAFNLISAKIIEEAERESTFKKARAHADMLGVPLVNYGCGTREPLIARSDINIDIIPREAHNFIQIPPDGKIPLPDNSAVVYAAHVLEHTQDPQKVLKELRRVGPTYIVLPRWWNIYNWISPKHRHIFTSEGTIENPASFSMPLLTGFNILILL